MAKAKKTKKEKIEETSHVLEPVGELNISQPKKIDDCEWVFQFDTDEPQVFAWTDDEMNKNEDPKVIFSISNIENTDKKSKKSFKIFAREISEEGNALREKQREQLKNLENASQNKED
jgi:hypothetical protein